MKTLAFAIALVICGVGLVGLVTPAALVWLAHYFASPSALYLVAAIRVAFGLLLLLVAAQSRFPEALRVVAFIPLLAGLATPVVGFARAVALLEQWTQLGPGAVRATSLPVLALGGFIAYACAPVRRAA